MAKTLRISDEAHGALVERAERSRRTLSAEFDETMGVRRRSNGRPEARSEESPPAVKPQRPETLGVAPLPAPEAKPIGTIHRPAKTVPLSGGEPTLVAPTEVPADEVLCWRCGHKRRLHAEGKRCQWGPGCGCYRFEEAE